MTNISWIKRGVNINWIKRGVNINCSKRDVSTGEEMCSTFGNKSLTESDEVQRKIKEPRKTQKQPG